MIGLLPRLSPASEALMGSKFMAEAGLGGWSIDRVGHCYPHNSSLFKLDRAVPFGAGSVVQFTVNFSDKSVVVRCGEEVATGSIQHLGKEGDVFPAISMYFGEQYIEFV